MSSFATFLLLTFSAIALIVVAKSDRTMPVEMEENELVSLLNSINKPAVTSFQVKVSLSTNMIDIIYGFGCLCDQNHYDFFLDHIKFVAFHFSQTEHGDILDCIDINRQLAFDHPLLKNHTIQVLVLYIRSSIIETPKDLSFYMD